MIRDSRCPRTRVARACLSPDGKYVVNGHTDRTIQRWNAGSGELCGEVIHGHNVRIHSLAWSAQSRVTFGEGNGAVRMWAESDEPLRDALRDMNTGWIVWRVLRTEVVLQLEGIAIWFIWIAETCEPASEVLNEHGSTALCVASSAEVPLHLETQGSVKRTGDLTRYLQKSFQEKVSRRVSVVALSEDGSHVASRRANASVKIWNVETGELVGEGLEAHRNEVLCLAWSAGESHVASGGQEVTVRI